MNTKQFFLNVILMLLIWSIIICFLFKPNNIRCKKSYVKLSSGIAPARIDHIDVTGKDVIITGGNVTLYGSPATVTNKGGNVKIYQ